MDNSWNTDKGAHGYDNMLMSMKPIFLAKGPDIRQGYRVDPFMSLDIYPLTAKLLGIEPAPNNGTLSIVKDILRENEPKSVAVKSPDSGAVLETVSVKLVCILIISVLLQGLLDGS